MMCRAIVSLLLLIFSGVESAEGDFDWTNWGVITVTYPANSVGQIEIQESISDFDKSEEMSFRSINVLRNIYRIPEEGEAAGLVGVHNKGFRGHDLVSSSHFMSMQRIRERLNSFSQRLALPKGRYIFTASIFLYGNGTPTVFLCRPIYFYVSDASPPSSPK
jgi:hypothetical protein